jgi:GDPmannose 4,6-dehydratase
MHASNGILFNHESPRRGETFVTRKITKGVANIVRGKSKTLSLGNLDAIRDWGYAPEYVESMWMMLQRPNPDDYVIATGVGASVKSFVEEVFLLANLNWQDYVVIEKKYQRPTEVNSLIGNPLYANQILGWRAKTNWRDLAKIMFEHDMKTP